MSTLLAKSPYPGTPPREVTLQEHSADVVSAAEALFGAPGRPTRLGIAWGRFFQLDEFDAFARCTGAAAAFHDWGKANDGFQAAVRGSGTQLIRHEHLSGLLLDLGDVRQWLEGRRDVDWDVVLAAVISHHLKAGYEGFATRPAELSLVQVPGGYDGFDDLLRWIAGHVGLAAELPAIPPVWDFDGRPGRLAVGPQVDRLRRRLRAFERDVRQAENGPRRRLLWAVRAALIAADAAGSGLTRTGRDVTPWVAAAFDEGRLCDRAFVERAVIGPRVEEIRRAGRWRGWDTFQDRCAALPERALLLAPCGSGKTLAAWRWVAARLGERPAARVIFLYPTRATATEGFRDYVSWAPEADAALVHGTAEFDLRGMFETPEGPGDARHAKRFETEGRLFALGAWTRRVFSATADQFLAFLQYAYGPVCQLPLLADAVVVVDEVHSFDDGMFSALKDFLRHFRVPVLCMTATLPEARRRQLLDCGLVEPPGGRPEDLRAVAGAPRYRVRRVAPPDAGRRVADAVRDGRRVLWVVNQVKRAQRYAQSMGDLLHRDDAPVYCYHSRFRLTDRRDRHQEVVRAFQGGGGAALAVTTQVCEMSLDLDADLLVTEEAPVTALIQRMGRCNRAATPRDTAGDILVCPPEPPEDTRPYDREALAGVEGFLAEVAGPDRVSQERLEEALQRHGPRAARPDRWCSFLESGAYALGGEETFRDIEEFTVPAVLGRDVEAFLRADRREQPGFVLPVPRRLGRARDARLPRYLAVAPDAHYSPAVGFCDQPVHP
jgi:CRISPR-associated endonuclease/helicase Cas3